MVELVNGKKHIVIKKDGREEPFNLDKMKKALIWAAQNNDAIVDAVLESLKLKISNRITTRQIDDILIETASNLTSRITPKFDDVAKNLYLMKLCKEIAGSKKATYGDYTLADVMKKGIQYGIYDRKVVESFTEEEIQELNEYINPERDYLFDFLGLNLMMLKNSLSYTTSDKKFELPQHVFMRLAMFAFWKEPKAIRLDLIKERYDDLSLFKYTEATPKYLNSLRLTPQMASCVIFHMKDDKWSINNAISTMGIMSALGGGLAVDVSNLRAEKAPVAKLGKSSGPVPFIKMVQSTVTAYDQLGARPGACAVYFPWWHRDYDDLIMLKDEGGTDTKRARNLKYGLKLHRYVLEKAVKNEEIYQFDPYDAGILNDLHGKEFEEKYEEFVKRPGIRKKKVKALDTVLKFCEQRGYTGNIYPFFVENANEQTPFKDVIRSSNLCTEVFLPTDGSLLKSQKALRTIDSNKFDIVTHVDAGLISLCNLSSINSDQWLKMNQSEKERILDSLLRASDNLINYAHYPTAETSIGNFLYRPIGIGMSNLANVFAQRGIKFNDEASNKFMFDLMEDIAYNIYEANTRLAKMRGPFELFYETKWADGWLPIDYKYKEIFEAYASQEQKDRWERLREKIQLHGLRFATSIAIAPTATSSNIIGATESINPVKHLISEKTGTYVCKQLAPGLNEYGQNYEIAWDVKPERLIELAAIRQVFMDQGQSVDLFYRELPSASTILKQILYAEKLGLKSLYYMNVLKKDTDTQYETECESCQA